MQTLAFQNHSIQLQQKVISKNQSTTGRRGSMKCADVRNAVSAWEATLPGKAQETIAQIVVAEWHLRGGKGLNLSGSLQNAKQNLFRWLENPRGSEKYERYVATLLPVIADVMPIEIARHFGLKQGMTEAELVANAIKECSEAHHAKLTGSPVEKLEKEVREAAEALLRLLPIETMAQVASGLAAIAPGLL
ncbi:toxin YdaT family protein [Buttiauxella noackiae]|uniref:toxin YdaT family protein n=1 Tax=Buttiauxella noackiae TaxID=82992 RepID=UPI0035A7440D